MTRHTEEALTDVGIAIGIVGFAYIMAFLAVCLTGCHNQLTPQDEADLGALTVQVAACDELYRDRPARDACLDSVKKQFDAKENARFDGGFGGDR